MFTLLSPMNYDGWVASVFLTYSDGIYKTDQSYVGEPAGIRPVVSLATGTMVKGEGTSINPYVVEQFNLLNPVSDFFSFSLIIILEVMK